MTLDNVTLGSAVPVPEPGTLVLACLCAGMAMFVGRRRQTTRRIVFTLCALVVPGGMTAAPARAAILTYAFSGTYTSSGGAPLSDLLPDVELGDPFSGSITFDSGGVRHCDHLRPAARP